MVNVASSGAEEAAGRNLPSAWQARWRHGMPSTEVGSAEAAYRGGIDDVKQVLLFSQYHIQGNDLGWLASHSRTGHIGLGSSAFVHGTGDGACGCTQ